MTQSRAGLDDDDDDDCCINPVQALVRDCDGFVLDRLLKALTAHKLQEESEAYDGARFIASVLGKDRDVEVKKVVASAEAISGTDWACKLVCDVLCKKGSGAHVLIKTAIERLKEEHQEEKAETIRQVARSDIQSLKKVLAEYPELMGAPSKDKDKLSPEDARKVMLNGKRGSFFLSRLSMGDASFGDSSSRRGSMALSKRATSPHLLGSGRGHNDDDSLDSLEGYVVRRGKMHRVADAETQVESHVKMKDAGMQTDEEQEPEAGGSTKDMLHAARRKLGGKGVHHSGHANSPKGSSYGSSMNLQVDAIVSTHGKKVFACPRMMSSVPCSTSDFVDDALRKHLPRLKLCFSSPNASSEP